MRKLWASVDPIGIKQNSWDITREEQIEKRKKERDVSCLVALELLQNLRGPLHLLG